MTNRINNYVFAAIAMFICTFSMEAEIKHQTGDVILASSSMASEYESTIIMSTQPAPTTTVFLIAETTMPTTVYTQVTATPYAQNGTKGQAITTSYAIYSSSSGFTNSPLQLHTNDLSTPIYWEITIATSSYIGGGFRCNFECYYNTAVQ
jgi:hypothetical protein